MPAPSTTDEIIERLSYLTARWSTGFYTTSYPFSEVKQGYEVTLKPLSTPVSFVGRTLRDAYTLALDFMEKLTAAEEEKD